MANNYTPSLSDPESVLVSAGFEEHQVRLLSGLLREIQEVILVREGLIEIGKQRLITEQDLEDYGLI
jgi:hypothetical protein